MPKFSANLGFLWTEMALPDAVRRAAEAGFTAVECHFPYDVDTQTLNLSLTSTGLPMLGLNTSPGDIAAGDFGLAAVPGREAQARELIDQAITYANATDTRNVHVMAGKVTSATAAHEVFVANVRYAAERASEHGIGILIEPINNHDAPGYFLQTVEQARDVIDAVAADNVTLMFDCYHLQITQGDLTRRLRDNLDIVGHIQIAAAPTRHEPDEGEIHYPNLFASIDEMGYQGWIGAEYKPRSTTNAGLDWFTPYRHSA